MAFNVNLEWLSWSRVQVKQGLRSLSGWHDGSEEDKVMPGGTSPSLYFWGDLPDLAGGSLGGGDHWWGWAQLGKVLLVQSDLSTCILWKLLNIQLELWWQQYDVFKSHGSPFSICASVIMWYLLISAKFKAFCKSFQRWIEVNSGSARVQCRLWFAKAGRSRLRSFALLYRMGGMCGAKY